LHGAAAFADRIEHQPLELSWLQICTLNLNGAIICCHHHAWSRQLSWCSEDYRDSSGSFALSTAAELLLLLLLPPST
jgi:RecA-family ATPase